MFHPQPHSKCGLASRRVIRRAAQAGLTLIEFMVSITIGLILVAGISTLIAQQSSTQAELEKSSRQVENGRYAMELLQGDIQLAGYYGEYSSVGNLTVPTALPNPCTVTMSEVAASIPFAVQGYNSTIGTLSNGPTDTPAGCSLNALNYKTGTDILVVRHADTAAVTGALTVGQVYLQAGLTASGAEFSYVIAAAATTTVDTATFNLKKKDGSTAPLRKYKVNVYFVSPCSKPSSGTTCSSTNTDDGGTSVPTLKQLELSVSAGAPVFVTTPLVEGIENMQIDYGLDTSGDGAPDTYLAVPATIADWANVTTARINLLARNNEKTVGYVDTKTYNMGLAGTTVATNDNFKRRLFSELVRLINPSSRRDQ